jgi:hypothetical protein
MAKKAEGEKAPDPEAIARESARKIFNEEFYARSSITLPAAIEQLNRLSRQQATSIKAAQQNFYTGVWEMLY